MKLDKLYDKLWIGIYNVTCVYIQISIYVLNKCKMIVYNLNEWLLVAL